MPVRELALSRRLGRGDPLTGPLSGPQCSPHWQAPPALTWRPLCPGCAAPRRGGNLPLSEARACLEQWAQHAARTQRGCHTGSTGAQAGTLKGPARAAATASRLASGLLGAGAAGPAPVPRREDLESCYPASGQTRTRGPGRGSIVNGTGHWHLMAAWARAWQSQLMGTRRHGATGCIGQVRCARRSDVLLRVTSRS